MEAADEKAKARWVVYLQFGIPAALLVSRWMTGEIWGYGLGWQMFSR